MAACQITKEDLTAILQETVPGKFQDECKLKDATPDDIMAAYFTFFEKVIADPRCRDRLNAKLLTAALLDAFPHQMTQPKAARITAMICTTMKVVRDRSRKANSVGRKIPIESAKLADLLRTERSADSPACKLAASPSPSPSPPPSRGVASDILALYGIDTQPPAVPKRDCVVEEIESSQEVVFSDDPATANGTIVVIPTDECEPPPAGGAGGGDRVVVPDLYNKKIRVVDDCSDIVLDMEAGPDGFVISKAPDGRVITTRVPNIMLQMRPVAVKKRPAATLMKKPSSSKRRRCPAKRKPESSDEREDPEEAEGDDDSLEDSGGSEHGVAEDVKECAGDGELERERSYGYEWYKKYGCYGIKQKFGGKKQVFAVGGKRSPMKKAALLKIAKKAIGEMVDDGLTEENAKAWAHAQLAAPKKKTK